MLSPKQKKIAAKAGNPNKIDAKDFAVLKAEKAKGRGMGLEDEKLKPGKEYTEMKKGGMTKGQKKVGKVMKEFKAGKLHSGKKGPVVKNPKQAVAIALSEAGMSKEKKLKPVKAFMGLAAMAAKNPISGIGLAAKAFKKGNKFFGEEIFNETKDGVQKKMGGGMMRKPIMADEGTFIKGLAKMTKPDLSTPSEFLQRRKILGGAKDIASAVLKATPIGRVAKAAGAIGLGGAGLEAMKYSLKDDKSFEEGKEEGKKEGSSFKERAKKEIGKALGRAEGVISKRTGGYVRGGRAEIKGLRPAKLF